MILKLIYEPLLFIFGILYFPHLLKRMKQEPDQKRFLRERFGYYKTNAAEHQVIWIHAVSVGEVLAAKGFLRLLLDSLPDAHVVLSTTTPTGQQLAKKIESEHERVRAIYFPFDFGSAIKRAFDRIHPECIIIMETEIWPNLIKEAAKRGVPIGIVNGRISNRAMKRYRWIKSFTRSIVKDLTYCFVLSEQDKQRFLELGVRPECLRVSGNMKFDQETNLDLEEVARLQREWQLVDHQVLIGGSTHAGEETILIEAFQMLRREFPGLKLIVVPRYPERSPEVRALIERAGFKVNLASEGPQPVSDVLILDQMGILPIYYALADLVFVGGSLIPHGGQNPIEAARYFKPILHGAYVANFEEIYSNLDESGGAFLVDSETALYQQAASLLSDSKNLERAGRIAYECVEALKGATRRNLELLKPIFLGQKVIN